MKHHLFLAWLTVGFGMTLGCVTVTPVTIGQKTTLERQLMGEMEALSDAELLAISVRAGRNLAPGSMDDLQAQALAARRRMLFNRDDIDELKAEGCLGEALEARLVVRPCSADDRTRQRAELVARETQEDRSAVITWLIAADPVLTPADRGQVAAILRQIELEAARAGHWIQNDAGDWTRR